MNKENKVPQTGVRNKRVTNNYSQHFVNDGERPQNFIQETGYEDRLKHFPKHNRLIQAKDELVGQFAPNPYYVSADLRSFPLINLGTTFDVIHVNPCWTEYAKSLTSLPKVSSTLDIWSLEELKSLRVDLISHNPSFVFLWVGSHDNIENGMELLKHWGFRRCEDITWIKTNKTKPGFASEGEMLHRTTEHCLMGIKGTVRRAIDTHIIHANVDTDLIIAEEPPLGNFSKPEEIYNIIEHFWLGTRRLELFGTQKSLRRGWVSVGTEILGTNYEVQEYMASLGNRLLLGTTSEIELLRPKSNI